jgi:excisionase family DNA binding protein
MMPNDPKVLHVYISPRGFRPPEAAAYIGGTPGMIEVLMRSGQIPFRMIGASRVIFKEDLDRYLDSLPVKTGKLTGPQIRRLFVHGQ